jgi:hypothetical protein
VLLLINLPQSRKNSSTDRLFQKNPKASLWPLIKSHKMRHIYYLSITSTNNQRSSLMFLFLRGTYRRNKNLRLFGNIT